MIRREALQRLLTIAAAPLVAGCGIDRILRPQFSSSGDLTPITLVGAGDLHGVANFTYRMRTAKMVKAVLDADPTAWAFDVGDLVYDGTMQQYRDYHKPTWGMFLKRTLFTMGNHDRKWDSKGVAYYEYTRAPRYYAQNLGDYWRFYSLNSENVSLGGADAAVQTTWLKNDIAQNPNRHYIAMWHIPMFSNVCSLHQMPMTWPGKEGQWWQVLQDAKAEFVLSGHTHRWERFERRLRNGAVSKAGVRQFVVGTAGLKNMPASSVHPSCESTFAERGIVKFSLYADRYEWKFTDIFGVVRDKGVQLCKKTLVI
jgi:hypothetical protein